MHLTSTVKFARQFSDRGYTYMLMIGLRSLKILFHLRHHVKFLKVLHTNPDLIELIRAYPRIVYRYLDSYLAFDFTTSKKLAILSNHYKFLLQHTHPDFFKLVQERRYIWQENQGDNRYGIALEFPLGYDFEGDLLLVFESNSTPIYCLSFTFIPGQVTGISFEQAIFVGRIQGVNNYELVKNTTKDLHDIMPAALLMVALQGIASVYNVNTVIGVGNQQQLSNNAKPTFFNYDLFWISLGGARTKQNLFLVPVPFLEKPIQLIKPNHRKRTLRKRHYKNQLMLEVSRNFRDFFI